MPTNRTTSVIEHLRRTVLREGAGLGDGELLGRFLERHDDAALAALVRRHGPMVWGVCRRLLGHHDAEDAFQATFLVLVRKAASVVPRELVGNFLYGVAHQTALQVRRTAARRRAREVQVTVMPDTEAVEQDQWFDVKPLLDQELSHLPDIYRTVVVLCDLEGRTRKEVACQLGVPEGTVAGRLARARAMLAKRLTERGVTLSGSVLAAVLAQQAASAGVPSSVADSTIKAASLLAAGKAAAGGAISVKVAALTEGVLKAMLMSKLKAVLAVVLILGLVATGATIRTCRTAAGQDDTKPAAAQPVEPAAKQEKEKEAFTAWGEAVGCLQAGLGLRPGQKRVYRPGETVTLIVRVRNIGKETVKFEYIGQFLDENPPSVTDAGGKKVPQHNGPIIEGFHVPVKVSLAPGKEIELKSRLPLRYELRPANGEGETKTKGRRLFVGTGKVSLQYKRVFGNSSAGRIELDPVLSKLATGKLELEIESDPPPAAPGKGAEGAPNEKRVAFEMRDQSWAKVLERLVDLTGLPLISENAPPPGKFTFVGPKDKLYTIPEILGFVNKELGRHHLIVIRRERSLTMLRTEEATRKTKPAAGVPEETPPQQEREEQGLTAWGREVGGLQAGLGYKPGQKRAYHHGETVTLVVRVRNVGKEEVKFRYVRQFFLENPPAVTDGKGKPVPLERVSVFGFHALVPVNLAPGEEIEVGERELELRPNLYGTGKFSVQYDPLEAPENDKTLSKLATGKLELEVKDAEKVPQKNVDKEDVTGWGKEVGGLQAGVGFPPGEKRVFKHGETVTLAYWIRNLGKTEVKFEYVKEVFEGRPFHATDSDGKSIPQEDAVVTGGEKETRVPVTLRPSEEILLFRKRIELKPGNKVSRHCLMASGKVYLWYERLFGSTTSGRIDPKLSELATGKLELEVQPAPPAKEAKPQNAKLSENDDAKTKQDSPPRPVHLMHIALAMHGYHQAYGHLPPAGISGINDPNGKPLLSWRVAILPYIEQQELYKEFDLTQAWDHPTNKKLIAKMPKVFVVPGADVKEGETNYRVLVGPGTVFEIRKDKGGRQIGNAFSKITDGTSNTVMVVEAKQPTIWTKPDDLAYDPKGPLPKLGVSANGFHVAMADGSVRFIRATTPENILRPYLTGNNGKPRTPLDGAKPEPQTRP